MTQAIRDHASQWISHCAGEISVFDWFAAFFEICSFQGAAADLIDDRDRLERSRALLWQTHGSELASALDGDLDSTPAEIAASMRGAIQAIATGAGEVSQTELASAMAWVVFIDSMFTGLGSTLPSDSYERVMLARLRLSDLGRLTSELRPWGLVIPKAASGEYGHGVARVCHALTHIDLDSSCEITYLRVDDPGGAASRESLVIGVVAAVQNAAELDWRFFREGLRNLYEVNLPARTEEAVIARVLAALTVLSERAHLVLLPELVSSPSLTDAIGEWLANSRSRGRKWPIAVLAGTHLVHENSGRARNVANVLSGNGTVCLTQYKLNPYTFRHDHRTGLDFPGADPLTDYVENISGSPYRATILDITGLGRVVVTICEDTARWDPWNQLLLRAGPNICLAPIMNGQGAASWRWVLENARRIANEAGSSVLAINSGAILGTSGRRSSDYAAAAFPRVAGKLASCRLIEEGDSDGDGQPDWWLYEVT